MVKNGFLTSIATGIVLLCVPSCTPREPFLGAEELLTLDEDAKRKIIDLPVDNQVDLIVYSEEYWHPPQGEVSRYISKQCQKVQPAIVSRLVRDSDATHRISLVGALSDMANYREDCLAINQDLLSALETYERDPDCYQYQDCLEMMRELFEKLQKTMANKK